MPEAKHIGLFGGAFDPPHFGHAVALRHALDNMSLDTIWVVPSGTRRDKNPGASPAHRLEMIALFIKELFSGEQKIQIQNYLIQSPDIAFTADELSMLAKQYPDHHFTVIIGSDQSHMLDSWHDPRTLAKLADFFILARDGNPAHVPDGFRATVIDPRVGTWVNLSSTELRRRLAAQRPIEGFTTRGIIDYIKKNNLYQKTNEHGT